MGENAWLYLTSSWSIKNIEKRFKTFPESHTGATMKVLVWIIMDHEAEDPRGKTNVFRVPPYSTQCSEHAKTVQGSQPSTGYSKGYSTGHP